MSKGTPLAALIAGLVLLAIGILIQRLMPLFGRMAFQIAAAGSYDPTNYHVGLAGYYAIAALLIAFGAILTFRAWRA